MDVFSLQRGEDANEVQVKLEEELSPEAADESEPPQMDS